MILVTHEMGFARNVSNRVVFMNQGLIEAQGTPEEMFREQRSERFSRFILSQA
ncbi:L-cystine import ATP-binding protein TcyN [compost metagenome]